MRRAPMTTPERSQPRQTPDADSRPTRLFARVAGVLARIRPAIEQDGGDIELVGVGDDGVVHVRFHGACVGCPSLAQTLTLGIETSLRREIPEVKSVVCVW